MNIKKLALMGIATLAMTISATGFAQITTDELVVGDFYPGKPWSEIIATYGQPDDKFMFPSKQVKYGYVYNSIKGGQIIFEKENEYVTVISIVSNKLMATRKGIRLGATENDIINAYGTPDKSDKPSNPGYNGLWTMTYNAGSQGYLQFVINKDKVQHIHCSGNVGSVKPPSQSEKEVQPVKSTIPDFVTEMPTSELNIGWIEPGQSMDNAEKVYGKPSKIDDEGFFQTYNYNDKFIVKGKMNNGYKVMSVASYEKGMKTPSGFMVGDSYSAVVKKFGAVKGIKFKGEGVEAKLKGCTDYTYFSGKKQMVFIVDKKDVIRAIRVEELDEQKFIEAKRKK